MKILITRILNFIYNIGIDVQDDAETRTRKNILTVASLAGTCSLIFWSLPMFILREPIAGFLWLTYSLLLMTTLIIWATTHRGYKIAVMIYIFSLLLFPLLLTVILGSFTRFGGAWYAILAMLAALVYYPHRFFYFCTATGLAVIISLIIESISVPTYNFPPVFFLILYGASFFTLGGITVMMLYIVIQQRNTAYHLIQNEQQKSESLLLNILPNEIANRLKSGSDAIADHLQFVSVLFADIVNFTPMSTIMTPVELVELLNEVFSYFDLLVEKYNLEKIKTIGDCYMVAAGVPLSRHDHALALTSMAVEMREYVEKNEFHGKKLSFRIGINSGEVVAGVIGKKKFSYDLWGDTVNIASRMESQGQKNIIQITRSTYELINNDFNCIPRGFLSIKGKGELEIWHVLNAKNNSN